MNRKGIGWFKLELVSYPENSCFLDAELEKHECIVVEMKKEESMRVCIRKNDLREAILEESDRSNVELIKRTEVVI